MLNPLTLPPRLVLRALDDLHSIALAAERVPDIERKLDARFDSLEGHLEGLLPALAKLERTLTRGLSSLEEQLSGGLGSLEKELTSGLGSLEEQLTSGFSSLEAQFGALPPALEKSLRPHLVKQVKTIESLQPPLEQNRAHTEGVPPRLDGLLHEMGTLRQEIQEVREVLEPLQGATERIGRISGRLPGSG